MSRGRSDKEQIVTRHWYNERRHDADWIDWDQRIVGENHVHYLREGTIVLTRLRCAATTKRGDRCKRSVGDGYQACNIHVEKR